MKANEHQPKRAHGTDRLTCARALIAVVGVGGHASAVVIGQAHVVASAKRSLTGYAATCLRHKTRPKGRSADRLRNHQMGVRAFRRYGEGAGQ